MVGKIASVRAACGGLPLPGGARHVAGRALERFVDARLVVDRLAEPLHERVDDRAAAAFAVVLFNFVPPFLPAAFAAGRPPRLIVPLFSRTWRRALLPAFFAAPLPFFDPPALLIPTDFAAFFAAPFLAAPAFFAVGTASSIASVALRAPPDFFAAAFLAAAFFAPPAFFAAPPAFFAPPVHRRR